jgi:hypothetical protein
VIVCGISPSDAQEPPSSIPPSSSTSVVDVTDPKHIHWIIDNFQQQLIQLGSDRKVTACDSLIQYYGPVTNTARRGYSFGAACVLSGKDRPIHVVMCDDFMVGKFTLGPPGAKDKERLIRFTRDNCPPGG